MAVLANLGLVLEVAPQMEITLASRRSNPSVSRPIFLEKIMRKADITQGLGFASRRALPEGNNSERPPGAQPFARKGMTDKMPNRQSWQSNFNANSVMVRRLQEFERQVNLRNQLEMELQQMQWQSQWQPQPQPQQSRWQPQQQHWEQQNWQQQQFQQQNLQQQSWQQHRQPVAAVGYPQAQVPTSQMVRPVAVSGIRQPSIRPEVDVVNHVLNLLQIPMADPRLSVNFERHPEGFTEDPRKLNIEFSNPQELNQAHAALSNIRQEIRLSNGEIANIQSVASGPSIPGQSGQVDIYLASQSGLTGRLVVSMANPNPPVHGGLSSAFPVRQHPDHPPILRQPNEAPRNAGTHRHVRFA